LTDFQKNTQISTFMKIHPLGAEMLHAGGQTHRRMDGRIDRQTDMTTLIVAFHNVSNAPKNRKWKKGMKAKALNKKPSSIILDFLTLEDVTNRLSRNVGTGLPLYAA
jgi:hypothetical protein